MSVKDKRKLAVIMFTDVVGYSRMMATNEERTLELLKEYEFSWCGINMIIKRMVEKIELMI